MTWFPISNFPIQLQNSSSLNYDDAVVKFYSDGTTTPITISADVSGTTTAAYATLNSSGYLCIDGVISIIHVQEPYKMVLYPDQCTADADLGAEWTLDVINPQTTATMTTLTATTAVVANGYLSVGSGVTPGTSGDNVIVMENGTAPTTGPANSVQLYSLDLSAGNTMLGIYTEGTPLSGGTTQVGTMALKLNGTTRYFLTSTVAGAGQVFNGITLVEYTDTVYPIVDSGSVDINPANGHIQTWTLGANRTPTSSISDGQRVRLMIADGASAYAVNWTTIGVTWVNNAGVAITLPTTGYGVVDLWSVGGTVYGQVIGNGT